MPKYFLFITAFFLGQKAFSAPISLNCRDNAYRNWWDVRHYDLEVRIDPYSTKISGNVLISARAKNIGGKELMMDLDTALSIDSILFKDKKMDLRRFQEKSYLVSLPHKIANQDFALRIYYSGKPRIAKQPPWDGGFVRTVDSSGNPWLSVACQGLGASVWWPCKDFPNDEPDEGADIRIITNQQFSAISNGRLVSKTSINNNDTRWHWQVKNPINLYNITFYIGDYVHWQDTFNGAKGKLDLDFWVLRPHLQKAKKQFAVVKPMLHCFEHWMGPYPFYEDGYKLVEAPFLGMEHQSAIAYGNEYKMGYLGTDRSKTGVGLLFDFIIAHESGHEWFGNSISAVDEAYSWVHEGFTTYSETLLAECLFGKEKAFAYQRGEWLHTIKNDKPVEGQPGQCDGGSIDHYSKGSAMVHMMRMMLKDDDKFRQLLRGINQKFYHQTVSGPEMEVFIKDQTGLKLDGFFEQYLRRKDPPVLVLEQKAGKLQFKWENAVPHFQMPILIFVDKKPMWITPSTAPKSIKVKKRANISVSPDFYITLQHKIS